MGFNDASRTTGRVVTLSPRAFELYRACISVTNAANCISPDLLGDFHPILARTTPTLARP